MKLLVLGGTVFLSRAVTVEAVARGHDVVAVSRGVSGTVPDGVRHVVADRAQALPAALIEETFDAVVDVSGTPSHVRRAVAAWPGAHWVFVSTVSVYADGATPGQTPQTGPVHEPAAEDVDLAVSPEAYGPMKVACEQIVRDAAAGAAVVRPGLVVGPEDPSGRFAYWPARMARVREGEADVLAPGAPGDAVQVIDVRDLAAWIVTLAERRTAGTFDGVGPVTPVGDLLGEVAAGVGAEPTWWWTPRAALEAADVRPWAGERSVPLWLPRPDLDGMLAHDPAPAAAAGLVTRSVAETARDTLAWLRATPDAAVTGLTAAEEAQVLAAVRGA
ncbi:epimerase [Xylanimonas oleitrophica]|uniref:UDP-glucose 4-epimerase n=1 Tax=Xylanimonas oleitrophica TaxID=2607479 RepID=A0A2W5Y3F3_9MICO|nr:NAD-dependent epimerase/dehydratase family protein [Xylanimonas oleitrophica]PZR52314.1 epimerase [Xylanimonas oleitrophica]